MTQLGMNSTSSDLLQASAEIYGSAADEQPAANDSGSSYQCAVADQLQIDAGEKPASRWLEWLSQPGAIAGSTSPVPRWIRITVPALCIGTMIGTMISQLHPALTIDLRALNGEEEVFSYHIAELDVWHIVRSTWCVHVNLYSEVWSRSSDAVLLPCAADCTQSWACTVNLKLSDVPLPGEYTRTICQCWCLSPACCGHI